MKVNFILTFACDLCVCCGRKERKLKFKTRSREENRICTVLRGALTHGAFPHQTDELMRPRLSRHPQQDFSEGVVGEPAVLRGKNRNIMSFYTNKLKPIHKDVQGTETEAWKGIFIWSESPNCPWMHLKVTLLLFYIKVHHPHPPVHPSAPQRNNPHEV